MGILLDVPSRRTTRRRGNRRRGRRDRDGLFVEARLTEKRSERLHRAGALLLAAAALAAAGWFLLKGTRFAGRALFAENDLFALRGYDLVSDGRIQPHHIREYASLPDRANLFAIDIGRVCADLASVPLVKSVTVTRRLPGTLAVRVHERIPVGRVALPGAGFTLAVDAEGRLLGPSVSREPLPLIEGLQQVGLRPGADLADPAAGDALALLELCDTTRLFPHVRIRRIRLDGADAMDLVLAEGEQVRMPRRDMEPKLRRLAAILKTIRDRGLASRPDRVRIDMTTDVNFPVAGLDG